MTKISRRRAGTCTIHIPYVTSSQAKPSSQAGPRFLLRLPYNDVSLDRASVEDDTYLSFLAPLHGLRLFYLHLQFLPQLLSEQDLARGWINGTTIDWSMDIFEGTFVANGLRSKGTSRSRWIELDRNLGMWYQDTSEVGAESEEHRVVRHLLPIAIVLPSTDGPGAPQAPSLPLLRQSVLAILSRCYTVGARYHGTYDGLLLEDVGGSTKIPGNNSIQDSKGDELHEGDFRLSVDDRRRRAPLQSSAFYTPAHTTRVKTYTSYDILQQPITIEIHKQERSDDLRARQNHVCNPVK